MEVRLLKPGADTANIIQVYVSAIRALRQLDPSGVTLEAVSERVRAYLKARADTIRQIVTSLTDPETSELLEPASDTEGEGELLKDDAGIDCELCNIDLDEIKVRFMHTCLPFTPRFLPRSCNLTWPPGRAAGRRGRDDGMDARPGAGRPLPLLFSADLRRALDPRQHLRLQGV